MATRRRGINKYSLKSMQLNRELRSLLLVLEKNPNSTVQAVANLMDWSRSKARNSIENLSQVDLVYVSDRKQTPLKSSIHYYSVGVHTEDDLDEHLPIVRPEGSLVTISARASTGKVVKRDNSHWKAGKIQRDPLDLALMGTGVAPSLLFKRREYADASA